MNESPVNPAPKRARSVAPYQLREFGRRAAILEKVLIMIRAGESLNAAARETGEPLANLSRYVRAFRAIGIAGLVPAERPGAKSSAAKLALTEAEATAIAALSYRIVRHEDIVAGCRAYAAHPECRPELQAVLSGRIPNSVRKAIKAHIPKHDGAD